jgi:uncharacterized membrane protein YdjX (TVP38/TMEM64 family)
MTTGLWLLVGAVAVFGIGWFALWDGLKVRVARYRVAQELDEMLREKFSELR